jgi:hypothetical protein
MPKKIAFCGLDCAACPAYIAYHTNDQALRKKTAPEWSVRYNANLKPDDINCVGCTEISGPHIGHCAECEIRRCGLKKQVTNCGTCAEYPCPTIKAFHEQIPDDIAKNNL